MSRGRRFALWTAALGLLVLLAAGVASPEWLLEAWFIHKLQGQSEAGRKLAAEKLGAMRSVRAIPVLVAALGVDLKEWRAQFPPGLSLAVEEAPEPDFPLHYRARALVKIGRPALPALLEAFNVETHSHRHYVVQILAAMGPEAREAIPTLAAALDDRSEVVSSFASSALEAIGTAAIPALLQAVKHEDRTVRHLATAALAGIGPGSNRADLIPVLVELLGDDYEWVRVPAAKGLGAFGPRARAAIPALEEAWRDKHPSVRDAAGEALDTIEGTTGPASADEP